MINKSSWQAATVIAVLVILSLSCEVTAAQLNVNGDAGNDSWDGLAPEWDGTHGPKKTIQAGIDAAVDSDTVNVADGIYTGTQNENLDFAGRAITVRSENGPTDCIIDCQNAGRGFYFNSGELPNSIVEGLTIRNGHAAYGGGIYCYGSSPTIRDCVITSNRATYHGGGIYCYDSSIIVQNSIFCGNRALVDGGGIYASGWYVQIENCTVVSNEAGSTGGGIFDDYEIYLINCVVWGNEDGGGSVESAQISGNAPLINYSCIQSWTGGLGGTGNIGSDPFFADPANDDFHLKSQEGRWKTSDLQWVADTVTSPCIDAGDADSDWTAELWPHGKRINMGAYGGTAEASMSLDTSGNPADFDEDDDVDFTDFLSLVDNWLSNESLLAQDISRDNFVNLSDFAMFAGQWLWQEP